MPGHRRSWSLTGAACGSGTSWSGWRWRQAIAPHRKTELHARLLAALEERGDADPAVLAHHAEGAGDEKAVLQARPGSGPPFAALGAHREAAAQFERALRFADADDGRPWPPCTRDVAAEYALLDRWPETEAALRTALGAPARARR